MVMPATSNVQTKNNALKEVGGAAAGALVGGLLFHGVGALIGAGGGAVLAEEQSPERADPARFGGQRASRTLAASILIVR